MSAFLRAMISHPSESCEEKEVVVCIKAELEKLGLIPAGYKIMVVGSVQEEDCDGMCWQYIVNKFFPEKGIQKKQVEFVISTKIFESGLGISLFRDNSTRTRFSFASACNLLGLEVQAVPEGHRAGVLEQKPTLVNLQCDIDHPTQCMADMLHIIHEFGGVENLKGKKVAMSQGYIGYDLQNALWEELLDRGIEKGGATVLTQVEVDPKDPAFAHPTKPIGAFMTKEEADRLVVACGGGSIPVFKTEGHFTPGSMLPKVQAAVEFAKSTPGRSALITLLEKARDGVAGRTGTVITHL